MIDGHPLKDQCQSETPLLLQKSLSCFHYAQHDESGGLVKIVERVLLKSLKIKIMERTVDFVPC